MAGRIRGSSVLAGGIAVLTAGLFALPGSSPAQQSTPASGNSDTNQVGQPGTASQFLSVPLVKNIPGGVNPPPPIVNPVAGDPEAATRGMKYFVQFNCVGCHAPNGGGGMGPSLSEGVFKYGSQPEQHYLVIAHGAPLGMPAWGTVLPPEIIWDIVAYIGNISQAPQQQWGHTVSIAAGQPAIEQVPAEFKQSPTPWRFTEPFGDGNPPTESSSGAAGASPSSGSSTQ